MAVINSIIDFKNSFIYSVKNHVIKGINKPIHANITWLYTVCYNFIFIIQINILK